MALDQNIEKFLNEYYPSVVADKILIDCMQISNVLSAGPNSKVLTSALHTLDHDLSEHQKSKHSLSKELTFMERRAGINIILDGRLLVKAPTVLRQLHTEEAMHLSSQGSLFKDPGIDAQHGEYTHRLQWYILISQKVITFSPPVELLKKLGNVEKYGPKKGNATALWDCLFDRVLTQTVNGLSPYGANDFRCPEHFTIWLKNSESFPVLSKIISKRYQKREFDQIFILKNEKELDIIKKNCEAIFNEGNLDKWTEVRKSYLKGIENMQDLERKVLSGLHYLLMKNLPSIDLMNPNLQPNENEFPRQSQIREAIKIVIKGYL